VKKSRAVHSMQRNISENICRRKLKAARNEGREEVSGAAA